MSISDWSSDVCSSDLRPNVIHQSEPVRAHGNNSSVEVTRKPLSVTSAERSSKKARSGCVPSGGKGPSVRGSSITPNQAPLSPFLNGHVQKPQNETQPSPPARPTRPPQADRPGGGEGIDGSRAGEARRETYVVNPGSASQFKK